MKNLGKRLVALLMIMMFSLSTVPALSIDNANVKVASKPQSVQIIGNSNIKNGNKRLSVSLRDSDIKQTVRMFADKAGLNVIFHESVGDKTITLDLVGVTLNDAIRMVMQASDLSYFVDGQTLIVMSAEKSKEMNISKQNMMLLPVKYADATDVADFLNKNIFSINKPGLSNTEIVSVNPASNELIIFGTKSDYDMAAKVLAVLDEPTRVTNFKVKHITPKEMAKNICTALIKGYSENDNGNNSDNNKDDDDDEDDDSSDSSGGQSSGLSAGDAGSKKVSLGKAKLACSTGDAKKGKGGSNSSSSNNGKGPSSINKNGMKIMYFDTLDTVSVIGGSKEQLDTIAAYISATDVKQPMAYLEMSIIELNEDGSKEFQTNWQFFTDNFAFNLTAGHLGIGTATNPIYWTTANRSPNGHATISSWFEYIVSNKKGKLLANPKVMITSGKTSTIDLSSDYVQKVESKMTTSTFGYPIVSREVTIAKDQGIIISLTPFISRDGYVTMNISPTYNVPLGQERYGSGDSEVFTTLMTRRDLNLNNIRVKDSETLIIGGLIQETESDDVSKIPFLGDIPGLGFLFRNTKAEKKKEELVILITPHIIHDSDEMAETVSL